ncbi:MAG: hypothetical protein ABIP97_09235 [Chthoniobacterales bacterium]
MEDKLSRFGRSIWGFIFGVLGGLVHGLFMDFSLEGLLLLMGGLGLLAALIGFILPRKISDEWVSNILSFFMRL